MSKQPGEIIRRAAFNGLDALRGSRQNRLKKVNMREIVEGVSYDFPDKRLQMILKYAKEHSKFYSQYPEILSKIPVQTKQDFLEHYEDILSDEYKDQKDSLAKFSTSGSTGTPFTVVADPEKLIHVNMNFMAVMELNGFRLGMKRGEFRAWIKGKNTRSPLKLFVTNLVPVDISNMGDENVAAIYEQLKKEKVQCLVIYSSALTALVEYADRHQLHDIDWSVEMIFTMGEACPASTRQKAEEIFGIRPVLSYGNNENGFIAVSLDGADTYTIDLYSYYIEILKMDSDEPAEEGELGRIVVTDFYNRAFPMIRYDTGDTGKIRRWTDSEGRRHAEFTEIYGRRGSLIYNTKGEPLSIHVFMNNMLNFEGVLLQVRVIQTGIKDYTLMIHKAEGAEVDEEQVKASYAHYLGEDARFTLEYIDALPIQASGKTMVCEQRCEDYL